MHAELPPPPAQVYNYGPPPMSRNAPRISRGGSRHPPQQPAYYYDGDSPVARAPAYNDPYGYDDPPSPQIVSVPVQVRRQSLANGRLLVGQVQAPPPVYTDSELHHHHHHHHIHGQPRNMAVWNNAAFQQVGAGGWRRALAALAAPGSQLPALTL